MVSTSGSQLLPEHAVEALIQKLLPMTMLLTPNLPEAKLILQTAGIPFEEPTTVDDIAYMAKAIHSLGPRYVLLKGGHLPLTKSGLVSSTDVENNVVLNVLYGEGKVAMLQTEYIQSKNTHGTGCSLACKSLSVYLPAHTLMKTSCNRLQLGLGHEYDCSGQEGQSVRRGRHQDEPGNWAW